MIRKGIRPGFRFSLDLPGRRGYRRVLPFRRSWKVLAILAALDAIFLFPSWMAFQRAAEEWSNFEKLFDLVGAVFMSAWLIGWSVVPILLTLALLALLFAREVVRASPQGVELFMGLPFFGFAAVYEPVGMRNLGLQPAEQHSGKSWRGPFMGFDYGANAVSFGSYISEKAAAEIKQGIETATGTVIRTGRAQAEETSDVWEPDKPPAPVAGLSGDLQPEGHNDLNIRPVTWTSSSSLLLILANLVPIAGAVFLGWSLAEVMVLYWCESAIIGFYNLCKLVVISRWAALITGPFFLAHFSAFMAVHFLFIYEIFVEGLSATGAASGGDLQEVGKMFVDLLPALLALFISHGYSFLTNFVGRVEFQSRDGKDQMAEPYKRIIFMHLVLIFGGGLSLVLGNATPVLLLVIAVKIAVDVQAHIREHAPAGIKPNKPGKQSQKKSRSQKE